MSPMFKVATDYRGSVVEIDQTVKGVIDNLKQEHFERSTSTRGDCLAADDTISRGSLVI